MKFYPEPGRTAPGEVTFSGRGWLEENRAFANPTERRSRGKGAKIEQEGAWWDSRQPTGFLVEREMLLGLQTRLTRRPT